jgi:transposase InsO family protein
MKSIQEQREYEEPSMKPHTVKKYQDSTTHNNSGRGGSSQYKANTKHGRASTETHKLDDYNSDTEDETIKHSNRNKDNKGDREKKIRGKYMDINEAHYRMGHLGETVLRSIINHHGIKATGTFKNCISCMKWRGGNKRVSKVDVNPAKYPEARLHVDSSGPLPLPQEKQEYWLQINDAYSRYSWDYFMANKSSTMAILRRHILYLKTRGTRIKTISCDNAKEQMQPLKNMCWELGVQIECVAPYTPQQNGKV